MCVQLFHIGRQFRRQDQRLTKAADTIWRWVTTQISKPGRTRSTISRVSARATPALPDASRLIAKILRKVKKLGADRAMNWMYFAICRMAQRDDQYLQSALLQRQDLLRDESL